MSKYKINNNSILEKGNAGGGGLKKERLFDD